ncbi:hypothetical protein DFH07DRAFT_1063155, partial [Mycena maculata]
MDTDFDFARPAIVVDVLRPRVLHWLNTLLMADELYGVQSILPPGFPLGGFVMEKTYAWTSPGTERTHTHRVTFEHGSRSDTSSIFWRIMLENVTLGVFRIPPEVYGDVPHGFDLSAALVLKAMLYSVQARKTIALVAQIKHHRVQDGPNMLYHQPLQHFCLITLPEGGVVRR